MVSLCERGEQVSTPLASRSVGDPFGPRHSFPQVWTGPEGAYAVRVPMPHGSLGKLGVATGHSPDRTVSGDE
jgi:hypothetical protein